jgi:hypothetical protein
VPANFTKKTSINCIFSGRIPSSLLQIRLSFLDIGGNWFSSEVPGEVFSFWIGYLQLRQGR